MAKSRKQLVINGKTYQSRKDRKYENVNDKNDVLSRRQAEKTELKQQGLKSFEQKAKLRKQAGIPKGFKRKKMSPAITRAYYKKSSYSIPQLMQDLQDMPENTRGFVVAERVKNYPNAVRQTGESLKAFNARKNLHLQGAITQTGTPDYLLTHYKYGNITKKLLNDGYKVVRYEIIFTFIPTK